MENELACLDGQLLDASRAAIAVTDPGLVRGDGVFEVVRVYDGTPYALRQHLERMERSAAGLRLAVDVEAFSDDIAKLLAAREAGADDRERPDVLVRLIATRAGRRIVTIEQIATIAPTLALEPVTCAPTRILDGIKSLSYGANMLASRIAGERGADDALLVTPHGRVLECPTSSFFLVRDGEVRTAPLSDHVLDSITRRVVLAVATVREEPIAVDSLEGAQEAFVAGTPYEIVAVNRVGAHSYEAPGPRTREIALLVRERIASELR